MTEVRTTSSTGGQKGVKPERHSLMPRPGLDAIARVFGFGATKYDSHNWRKGYEWSKSYDALVRHVTAFWDGETLDPESGLPHLAHAGFHILVLLTWLEEQGEGSVFDDRYRPEPPAWTVGSGDILPCSITADRVSVGGVTFHGDGRATIGEEPFSWGPGAEDLLRAALLDSTLRIDGEDELPARFVVGPHGTEDHEADAMTVEYHGEHRLPLRDTTSEDDGWGTVAFDRRPHPGQHSL